jgi:16S rRNA (cytosine967-C5)-methyltransferase
MVAMDIDAERLKKVADNLQRLGLDARLIAGDGASPPAELEPGSFDRILVDAPCSATGVIRRNPDVKLLRRSDDLPGLASHQLGILRGLWPLLRPGGRLLYATCSVLAQENDQVISAFTGSETSATVATPATEWGEPTATGRQLLPSPDGSDGLFYALLDKG